MTPVLFLIFNRPEPTRIVFEQIRLAKPSKLFIAADGPRQNKKEEKELCEETRNIIQLIDWDCEVKTLFRTENLGCGKAVSSAIDWFFENVEEGIILEDDCLPNQSFFTFCEEMLNYYRDDKEVMHIGGTNYQNGVQRGDGSYYFSRYAHIWGWATWRNRWKLYDYSLKKYSNLSTNKLGKGLGILLNSVMTQKIDTWDIQWFFSVWFNEGFAVTPNFSLVRNIGYGFDATHTNKEPSWLKIMTFGEISSTIKHPSVIKVDKVADTFVYDKIFKVNNFKNFIKNQLLFFNKYFQSCKNCIFKIHSNYNIMIKKIQNLISEIFTFPKQIKDILIDDYLQKNLFQNPKYTLSDRLNKYEFQVFSQNGEDGIIEEIFNRIGVTNNFFVEFGVEDGLETNSTYLLYKDWQGLWLEGSGKYVNKIKDNFKNVLGKQLIVQETFITAENIEKILSDNNVPKELDLLSIDIDGNDYYVWDSIKAYNPRVVIIEYNSSIRPNLDWKMRYNSTHVWDGTMYFNSSLKSLEILGNQKGYNLVGCTFNGTNAFFVRKDLVEGKFSEYFSAEYHFEPARFFLIKKDGHRRKFGEWNS